MPQTSNRLVLQVDRTTMGGSYLQGINTINANSYMVNKLAVRIGTIKDGVFTQGKLLPGETLWVTFEKQGTSITKTMLLAEQEITQLTATAEVDGVTITEVPTEKQYEYVLTLPQAIMKNAGTWEFSLALRHVASLNVENISDVKYRGEWDASTGATQITGTPSTGDYYVCNTAGLFNPDGTNTGNDYTAESYAVYTGVAWVKSTNLFAFDYTKTSTEETPYNLVVQNSVSEAKNNELITNETAAAFYLMAEKWLQGIKPGDDTSLNICCAVQAMLSQATGSIGETNKTSVKAGEPIVGQYAIYANGIAKVVSVEETTFTIEVVAYHYIRINGGVSTTKTIFAPTAGGTSGYVLVGTGSNGAPIWRRLSINGSAMTADKSIYVPTTAGVSNYVLVSSGGNGAPIWKNPATLGIGAGNQYTFTVTDSNDESATFVFTLFGVVTFEDTSGMFPDEMLLRGTLNQYVGYNKIVPASGIWGGESIVWGIKLIDYNTLKILTSTGEYVLPTTAQFTYYTQPLSKEFRVSE